MTDVFVSLWDALPPTMEQRYQAWRASEDGRRVYAFVRDHALRMRRRGWRHYGVGALFEAARYAHDLEVGPDVHGFKLNHNWRSRLARELMDREPELAGLFETRELRS